MYQKSDDIAIWSRVLQSFRQSPLQNKEGFSNKARLLKILLAKCHFKSGKDWNAIMIIY